MKGQELIINLDGDTAYLSEETFLSLKRLGFPDFVKSFTIPASLKIRVINYNTLTKRVFAEILQYNTYKQPFPSHQLSATSLVREVARIDFRDVNTPALMQVLRGGQTRTIVTQRDNIVHREQPPPVRFEPLKAAYRGPFIQTITERFSIPLKKINFRNGFVSFDQRVIKLLRTIEIKVANEFIREEFDAVKNYFGNILKTKKIQFDVVITLTDNEITSTDATSPEIGKIDAKTIESVRYEIVKGFVNKRLETKEGDSLFKMEDLVELLADGMLKAEVFYDNENALLEDLMHITNSKHYNQLRFLSKRHAHNVMKLRFVIKPFSFVFLVEGKNNYHIVWETLDTAEATYIWHEKDRSKLKLALNEVAKIISGIKTGGKIAYINSAAENFTRIYHDYSDVSAGFVKWKDELENMLT